MNPYLPGCCSDSLSHGGATEARACLCLITASCCARLLSESGAERVSLCRELYTVYKALPLPRRVSNDAHRTQNEIVAFTSRLNLAGSGLCSADIVWGLMADAFQKPNQVQKLAVAILEV